MDEAGFQAALDDDNGCHTTRLVFADWLEEHDDPRFIGYRLMGLLQIFPRKFTESVDASDDEDAPRKTLWTWGTTHNFMWKPWAYDSDLWCVNYRSMLLPGDWIAYMDFRGDDTAAGLITFENPEVNAIWVRRPTRKEAEDEAALAFLKMNDEQRELILKMAKIL